MDDDVEDRRRRRTTQIIQKINNIFVIKWPNNNKNNK